MFSYVCPYDLMRMSLCYYVCVSSYTQISHTTFLYGGLKPIQTLGSVMTCADHCVRDLFDIITVYGGMPLPKDHVGS